MMRWIISRSLKMRFLLVAMAVLLMVFGISQLHNVPVDVLPEFSRPYVEIQTEALGLSAAEVEALITVPLEADMLNGVSWVDDIHSESIPGLSSIVLIFEPGTDIMAARQMVQERLVSVHALPNVSKPPAMLQPLSSTSRVMKIGLSSDEMSLIDMSVLARWTIRPRLMGVPGVANVAIWGQRKRQLQVQVDPKRLKEQGVTLQQIIKTTGNALWVSPLSFLNASTPGTGGFIDTPNQRLGVRHLLPISTPEELAQVTVEGATMPLGDVADVVENHQPLIGDAIVNDAPSLLLVVEKFPWANTLEVTRGVEGAIEALRPGLSGMEMDSSIYRPATFIEMAIDNLGMAILIGGVLVALVLGVFLYNWRTALISFVAILLSLTAAGFVLYLYGATVNAMVLAGLVIALGVVVDDAIIDVENVARRLRQRRGEGFVKSAARVILEAALEMRKAIVYATLVIVLAVVPLFFMGGLSGAFFQPFAFSFGLAVLASMVVALSVTPALSRILLSRAPLGYDDSPTVAWLRRGYDAVFSKILRRPLPVCLAVGAVILVGLAALPRLRQESVLPTFKELDLLIEWEGAAGTSQPEMSRIASRASRELRAIAGVRNVGAHVGRAVMSDEVGNINSGELWVSIDTGADYDATVDAIQEVVDGYPGLSRNVLTYMKEQIGEALGTDEAMVVRIYGDDLEILRRKAVEVQQVLSKIDGIVKPQVDPQVEEPQVEIEVDLAAARLHGLKPGDVRRAAACLLSGIEVGNLFEQQKVFDVVVWGRPEARHSLTSIRELLIDTPNGELVQLEDVADVRIVPAVNVIKRDAVSRYIDVGAGVRGRAQGAVGRDIERRLQEVQFPLEYRAELLGEYAQRLTARKRVLSFAVAAAIGTFLLLQAAFRSWRLAILVFLSVPMALVGGILVLLAGGGVVSFGSLIGFYTVLAIASRNAITLMHHYQYLQEHEGETFGPELVLRGTRERFAPIVMTTATVGLAFLPLALLGSLPGFEVLRPIAVVVLGGLLTSTLLTLFGLPALYLLLGTKAEPPIIPEPRPLKRRTPESSVPEIEAVSSEKPR